jgi:hypothetical protein
MIHEQALSDLIGALVLSGLFVAVVAIILVQINGHYPPPRIPETHFEITNNTKTFQVTQTGGETIPVIINATYLNKPPETLHNQMMETGNRTEDPIEEEYQSIQVLYNDTATNSKYLMIEKKLK